MESSNNVFFLRKNQGAEIIQCILQRFTTDFGKDFLN